MNSKSLAILILGLFSVSVYSYTPDDPTGINLSLFPGTLFEFLPSSDWIRMYISPNLPGALFLLFLSALISTLTFYSDLKRSSVTGRGSIRYLVLWIFGNYLFALIMLLLILPPDKGFNEMDRTMLLYCLVASSMPELSAYLKIQLGNSERGINLYKIRESFTQYVSNRVGSISDQGEWRELGALKEAFSGRGRELHEKLVTLANVCNLPEEQKESILTRIKDKTVDEVFDFVSSLDDVTKDKVLCYFAEELERYQESSKSKLIRSLYPPISPLEADALIINGVTSPIRFFIRTTGQTRRSTLQKRTQIDLNRLALIHNEMRSGLVRRTTRGFFKVLIALVILCVLATALYVVGKNMENAYRPDSIILEEEVPLALHKTEFEGMEKHA